MHFYLQGFLLQASLILALGAQNLFVLESGLEKRRPLLVAFVCSACDALLIFLGVAGASAVFARWPLFKIAFGVLGVSFLFYYGVLKIREGLRPQSASVAKVAVASTPKQVVMLALGFSLLNPHVYLDTVILIGGYSSQFAINADKAAFGLGAASFSVLWFYGLTVFATAVGSFLKSPKAMARISLGAGLILLVLSLKLGLDVLNWF